MYVLNVFLMVKYNNYTFNNYNIICSRKLNHFLKRHIFGISMTYFSEKSIKLLIMSEIYIELNNSIIRH